ncbi:DUF1799 domain-containing protein [Dyella ginsengisoli]|uniref:DUF1799 domain-containing protein n=1 Tax=Dyella ginsengisoli TaxID=363848 RepID=UPI00384DF96E
MQDYCRSCRKAGGCGACPQPTLLPENVPALTAYRLCDSQWRTSLTGATGLDYTACIAALQLYLPRWQAEAPNDPHWQRHTLTTLLDDLRTIEDALLTAWDEKAQVDPNPQEER